MKKTFLSMLMIASCFGVANAQLMVDENGKVGVGMIGENIIPLTSKLTLNGIGRSDSIDNVVVTNNASLEIESMGKTVIGTNTMIELGSTLITK